MTNYTAPLDDMMFVLEHVVGLERLPPHADLGPLDPETVRSILESAAQLAHDVISPTNAIGDKQGLSFKDHEVTMPKGFKEAYAAYCEGGWNALPFTPDHGGQGLPWTIAFPVQEMWQGANMSFGLCPLLNQGAVEAIYSHADDSIKARYLEKLISGEWAGTMNITEAQAGSDLASISTRALPQQDGTYLLSGQKIFITYGEHDLTDNIIHLVLARLPDAPEGVKGISLFVVPKFLPNGQRNDVLCTGIEHKLGIHASPTCTMQFGDQGGAVSYLVGEAHQGLKYMFTMMNNARLSVGLQGVAIAQAALQKAVEYAKERVQGTPLSGKEDKTIAAHPDVRRMLLLMACQVDAARGLTYEAALSLDLGHTGNANAKARTDLLTPIVKSWATDMAVDVTSMAIQIHGGMGFIEEAGVAQLYRDARILPIYEGTNGIQSADLVFRKILRDDARALKDYFAEMQSTLEKHKETREGKELKLLSSLFESALSSAELATQTLQKLGTESPSLAAAASTPFLSILSSLCGGYCLLKSAYAAKRLQHEFVGDPAFLAQKIIHAEFFFLSFVATIPARAETLENIARTILKRT